MDHVQNYKVPKVFDEDGNELEPDEETVNNAAPKLINQGKAFPPPPRFSYPNGVFSYVFHSSGR